MLRIGISISFLLERLRLIFMGGTIYNKQPGFQRVRNASEMMPQAVIYYQHSLICGLMVERQLWLEV